MCAVDNTDAGHNSNQYSTPYSTQYSAPQHLSWAAGNLHDPHHGALTPLLQSCTQAWLAVLFTQQELMDHHRLSCIDTTRSLPLPTHTKPTHTCIATQNIQSKCPSANSDSLQGQWVTRIPPQVMARACVSGSSAMHSSSFVSLRSSAVSKTLVAANWG